MSETGNVGLQIAGTLLLAAGAWGLANNLDPFGGLAVIVGVFCILRGGESK